MRSLTIMAILLMVSACTATAGDTKSSEPFRYEAVHDVPGKNANEIFDASRLWIAETFRSGEDVTDLADREMGTIIGNGIVDVKIGWMAVTPARFQMRIDVKDGKVRTSFTDIELNFDGQYWKPIEDANRGSLEPKMQAKFDTLVSGLKSYIANSSTDW